MRYLVKRLLAVIPVLFGVSVVVFSMLHLVPGDPVKMMLSEFQTSPEQIARLRAQLYLDESLPKQFGRFLWNAVHGDLGYSMRTRRPVGTEILESLPSTVTLALAGMVVAVVMGVTLGVIAASRQRSWFDSCSMLVALLGVSMPSFWFGLLLIFAFSLKLGWLPGTGGRDRLCADQPAGGCDIRVSGPAHPRYVDGCMTNMVQESPYRSATTHGIRSVARQLWRNKGALGGLLVLLLLSLVALGAPL